MARSPLNYFEPYESLPPNHENQLTRALVVVLKLSPMAHAAWLRRVDPELALHELPMADWRVQRRDIVPAASTDVDGLRVISVFISGERTDVGGQVEASERGQVLDAISLYGTELAVVVEVKVTANPGDRQARRLNIGGFTLALDEHPLRLRWRDILGDLAELVSHQLVAGAEAGVIEDFLEYTEAYFDDLLPFNRLYLCHGSESRQQRRLRMILTEASGTEARQDRRPSIPLAGTTSVDRAYLELGQDEVQLSMFAADTLTQAKVLYGRCEAIEALRGLPSKAWQLSPNFHWGHMAKGLAWTGTPLAVDEYMDLWVQEIDDTHQLKRSDWGSYWEWLTDHQIVDSEGRNEFRIHFDDTARQFATPRPGVRLQRAWSLAEAEKLDNGRGEFAKAVREALLDAFDALHEKATLNPE